MELFPVVVVVVVTEEEGLGLCVCVLVCVLPSVLLEGWNDKSLSLSLTPFLFLFSIFFELVSVFFKSVVWIFSVFSSKCACSTGSGDNPSSCTRILKGNSVFRSSAR